MAPPSPGPFNLKTALGLGSPKSSGGSERFALAVGRVPSRGGKDAAPPCARGAGEILPQPIHTAGDAMRVSRRTFPLPFGRTSRRDAETRSHEEKHPSNVVGGLQRRDAHRHPPTRPCDGPKPAMPCMTRERQRRDTRQPGATPQVGPPTTDPSPERASSTMSQGRLRMG